MNILRLIELLSGVNLSRVAEFGWELVGKPKAVEFSTRRAEAFMQHLRTKHPEWFRADGLHIPLTGGNGASYGAIMLAMFYALRCAAKGPTCRHKP